MRVLFACRPDYLSHPGGDTIQVTMTKRHLMKLGVDIDIVTSNCFDAQIYDLVHLFNITRVHDTYEKMRCAKNQGMPVVLSTIYWDMEEYLKLGKFPIWIRLLNRLLLGSKILNFGRWIMESLNGRRRGFGYGYGIKGIEFEQKEALKMADVLLPNGLAEQKKIEVNFGILDKYHLVTNGVVPFEYLPDPNTFLDKFADLGLRERGFVLFVGTVGDRKNVHKLIRSVNDLQLPLVIIGPGSTRSRYYTMCRKIAGPKIYFLGHMEFEKIEHAYASARVHALPSWYETPGLASLEAGLAGCNIVTTDRGTTQEYFQDLAWYCDPKNVQSIHTALEEAWVAPRSNRLAKLIKEKYTWENAALQTLEAYNRIL